MREKEKKENGSGNSEKRKDSICAQGFRILILESGFVVAITLSASTACEGEAEAMQEEPEGVKCWKPGRGTGKAAESKELQQHLVPVRA